MTPDTSAKRSLGQGEFITLIAMMFATIALSIDTMLPAISEIGHSLAPQTPERAYLIIGLFFLGMGFGTLVAGPLSDAFGRKPIMLIGGLIYLISTLACYFSQNLEVLLAARIIQGFGAAGPRTVSLAMVRDIYRGRDMARIMSFAMMIFMLVPAVAPLIGQQIIALADWRAIFLILVAFSLICNIWLQLRQPETLPLDKRIPLRLSTFATSAKSMFSHRVVLATILIQALIMATLIALLSSIAAIFEQRFERLDSFPLWFAMAALFSAAGSFLNSRLVMSIGMRRVITLTLWGVLAISGVVLLGLLSGKLSPGLDFAFFMLWMTSLFCMMSLTMGNLNALAMEPVGHIAGFAASVMACLSTVLSVLLSLPVIAAFDGSHLALVSGAVVFLVLSILLMQLTRK